MFSITTAVFGRSAMPRAPPTSQRPWRPVTRCCDARAPARSTPEIIDERDGRRRTVIVPVSGDALFSRESYTTCYRARQVRVRRSAARRAGMRVVVLGGGIAGLTCALGIKRARPGCAVTVVEAARRTGGWLSSEYHGPFVFERGPRSFRISAEAGDMFRVIEELGLEVRGGGATARARACPRPDPRPSTPDAARSVRWCSASRAATCAICGIATGCVGCRPRPWRRCART